MVRPSRTLTKALMLTIVVVWTYARPHEAGADDEHASEYAVKAAYLLNFARFVTWPQGAFVDPQAPLTICILGTDPFGAVLDGMLAGEAIEGRKLAARRIATLGEAQACHILFVAAGGDDAAVVTEVGERPVFTVGDGEAFALAGGMVGFRIDQSTVRFTVNPEALRRAGLVMSSQVMRLARIVPGTP